MRFTRQVAAHVAPVLAAVTLGVVAPAVLPAPAHATPSACYIVASSTSVPIPDNGSTTSVLDVSAGAGDQILDLDVVITIEHSWDQDLDVSLEHGGNKVVLTSDNGSYNDDYASTRFDDGAATAIEDGVAPFAGSFRPEQSLNSFDDLSPFGKWTLRVTDDELNGTGTLTFVALHFKTRYCFDADRDGVKNDDDFCVSVAGPAPSGCPVRARSVSLTYNNAAKEFRGVLHCNAATRCAQRQPVRIYKVAAGQDQLLARTHVLDDGSFAVPRATATGKFYAVAPKVLEEEVAVCGRAQSPTLTR